MNNYYNPYELYHHGIKGQRWGVRRFQNRDGTYTNAGKRRRNDDLGETNSSRSSSGVGKKIATGLAIGATVGLTAYALANPKSRAYLKKLAGVSVSKLKAAATNPKVKEFVARNGKKAATFVGDRIKEGGKAFTDAAIAASGAIAVSKIATKVNTGNAEADKILTDATSAAINAMTKSSYSSNNNQKSGPIDRAKGAEISKIVGAPKQKEIDRTGPEYQALFKNQNGEQRDANTRGLIKSLASAGYGIDQISLYLDKLDKGEIKHSMFETELYHHGVKGMKWGVRRYRNYDGSYTKRGLDHYRQTEADYNEANSMYKTAKSAYKQTKKNGSATINGRQVIVNKNVVDEAKAERKRQKERLSKNYDQLKKDYQGDKGKALYQKGHTITGNSQKLQIAGLVAAGAAMTAKYLNESGKKDYAKYALYAGAGAEAIVGALAIKGAVEAKYLRAYYGHSGKYV